MDSSTKNSTARSLFIFVIIGAVLLAAVVLTVRWARNRSDAVASANQSQPAPTPKVEEQKPAEEKPAEPGVVVNTTPSTPVIVPANQTPAAPVSTPLVVPSTGAENIFLPVFALGAVVFAGLYYVKSKQRLLRLS